MESVIRKLNEIFESEESAIHLNAEEYDFFYMKTLPLSDIYRWGIPKVKDSDDEVKKDKARLKRLKKLDEYKSIGINSPEIFNKNSDEINGNGQTHITLEKPTDNMFWPFLNSDMFKIYTLHFPFEMFEGNIQLLLKYIPGNYYSENYIKLLEETYKGNGIKKLKLSLKLNKGRRVFASQSFISPDSVEKFYLENRYMIFVDDFFVILKKKQKMEYVLLFLSRDMLNKYDFDIKTYSSKLIGSKKIENLFTDNYIGSASPSDISILDINENISISGGKNLLVFGAPGTGKSYWVKENFEDVTESVRVTFHEEYSYSDFVGALKPESKNGDIDYKFKAGPFTKILALAIGNPAVEYTLIIEELNRANAAAVFGDIFQILDRDELGYSKYSVENEEITKYLKEQLNYNFDKVQLPANLNLIATMNSADQGVFALDTAFKRRWNFKYIPIEFEKWHQEMKLDYVKQDGVIHEISVQDFIETMNDYLCGIESLELNEDRLIGPYFIPEEQWSYWLDEEVFQKVLNYLWDDVARISRNEVFLDKFKQFSKVCSEFRNLEVVFVEPLHMSLLQKSTIKVN